MGTVQLLNLSDDSAAIGVTVGGPLDSAEKMACWVGNWPVQLQ